MKKNIAKLAQMLIVAAGLYTAYHFAFPVESWRYRMTVVMDTSEGTKTGTTVREVTQRRGIKLLPEMGASIAVKGEAVAIDLGKNGVIFAIMRNRKHIDYASDVLFYAFPSAEKQGSVTLPKSMYPEFVYFKDRSNPNTVQSYEDAVDAIYAGSAIKEVVIEITDDPVTWGIEKWLPWLPARAGVAGVIGSAADHPQYRGNLGLTGVEFSKGKFW